MKRKLKCEHISLQGSGKQNEDSLCVLHETFGVFDGASALVESRLIGTLSGGAWCSSTASKLLSSTIPLTTYAQTLQRKIKATWSPLHMAIENLPGTMMAVVRFSENALEFLQLGDSVILIINKDGSHSLTNTFIDQDAQILVQWKELTGQGEKFPRKSLASAIIANRKRANSYFGFMNGDPAVFNFLTHGYLDISVVKSVLLLTDGAMIPKENPRSPENWDELVATYVDGGVEEIARKVRELETADSTCARYPRIKIHDDLTIVAIDLV